MKILYIVPWPVPGEQTNLQSIISTQFGYYTLKEKNTDITWLTHNRNGGIYKLCKAIRMPQLNQIFCQLSVIGKERDYDVIYVGFDMHLLPLAVLKLLGLVRKPVFVLSHFSYNTQYTQSLTKKIYKRIERALVYRAIDKMTFASENLLVTIQRLSYSLNNVLSKTPCNCNSVYEYGNSIWIKSYGIHFLNCLVIKYFFYAK